MNRFLALPESASEATSDKRRYCLQPPCRSLRWTAHADFWELQAVCHLRVQKRCWPMYDLPRRRIHAGHTDIADEACELFGMEVFTLSLPTSPSRRAVSCFPLYSVICAVDSTDTYWRHDVRQLRTSDRAWPEQTARRQKSLSGSPHQPCRGTSTTIQQLHFDDKMLLCTLFSLFSVLCRLSMLRKKWSCRASAKQ